MWSYNSMGGVGSKANFYICTVLLRGKEAVNQKGLPSFSTGWFFFVSPSAAEEFSSLLRFSYKSTDAVLESQWSCANRVEV